MYGKATRKAWRRRTKDNTDKSGEPKQPGELVSVDQLISPTPGFIKQVCGILTTKRYMCAMGYVDQASKPGFYGYKRRQQPRTRWRARKHLKNMLEIGEFKSSIITQITGYSRAKRGS